MAARPAAPLVLLMLVALVGCGTPSATPSAAPASPAASAASPRPSITPVPGGPSDAPTRDPAASVPGQADTPWGRIWEGIPAWFPVPPGAQPTDSGPDVVSAAFEVPPETGDAAVVAGFYRDAIARLGYLIEGVDGPLEDGSFVVRAGLSGVFCPIEVGVAPRGAGTLVTIRYGASCRFD